MDIRTSQSGQLSFPVAHMEARNVLPNSNLSLWIIHESELKVREKKNPLDLVL